MHVDVPPWSVLVRDFEVGGVRVPLVSKPGIFKPRACELPLSTRSAVRTVVSRVALRPRIWLSSTPELFGSPKDTKARDHFPTLAPCLDLTPSNGSIPCSSSWKRDWPAPASSPIAPVACRGRDAASNSSWNRVRPAATQAVALESFESAPTPSRPDPEQRSGGGSISTKEPRVPVAAIIADRSSG